MITCQQSDCNTNNGGCGPGQCELLSEYFSEVAVCGCLRGYNPRFLGPCVGELQLFQGVQGGPKVSGQYVL